MLISLVAVFATTLGQQEPRRTVPTESKLFTYDAGALEQWYLHYGVDNDLEKARKSNLAKKLNREITRAGGVQVSVSGNFALTVTATGPATTTGAIQTTDVSIDTNRGMALTTSNFGSLTDSGNVARPTAGSVSYEFSVRRGGTVESGPVSGTDAGANGLSLTVPEPPGNSSRTYTLRIRRTVALTQLARGGETYTSSGRINISIN